MFIRGLLNPLGHEFRSPWFITERNVALQTCQSSFILSHGFVCTALRQSTMSYKFYSCHIEAQ